MNARLLAALAIVQLVISGCAGTGTSQDNDDLQPGPS